MKKIILLCTVILSTSIFSSPFSVATPGSAPAGLEYNIVQPVVEDPKIFDGKRVAILVSHGVQESEITYPYEYLKARGADIDIVSPGWANGKVMGVKYLKPTIWIKSNLNFKEALNESYDLVILTGGAWNSTVVRTDEDAIKLVQKNFLEDGLIASICGGAQVLINAGLANGVNLTGTGSIKKDLINSGATFINEPAVVDGTIITSRGPADVLEFMQAIHANL